MCFGFSFSNDGDLLGTSALSIFTLQHVSRSMKVEPAHSPGISSPKSYGPQKAHQKTVRPVVPAGVHWYLYGSTDLVPDPHSAHPQLDSEAKSHPGFLKVSPQDLEKSCRKSKSSDCPVPATSETDPMRTPSGWASGAALSRTPGALGPLRRGDSNIQGPDWAKFGALESHLLIAMGFMVVLWGFMVV